MKTSFFPADFNIQLAGRVEGASSRRHAALKAVWAVTTTSSLPRMTIRWTPGLIGRITAWEVSLHQVICGHAGNTSAPISNTQSWP